MSETALINKFVKNADDEIDNWLLATPIAQPKAEAKEQPKPAQPAVIERGGGFFNSIKRAAYAPIERIKEGAQQVANAGREPNRLEPYIGQTAAGFLEGLGGVASMVFPLSRRAKKKSAEPKR